MIRTVFVDLDDTLWATQENHRDCLQTFYHEENWGRAYPSFEAFMQAYLPINQRQWDLYRDGKIDKYRLTIDRFAPVLAPVGYASDEEVLRFSNAFLARAAQHTKVEPGAHQLLAYLQELYKVVVVSNGFGQVQRAKMQAAGLLCYVDHIILSEEVGVNKPNKAIFNYALSRTKARRSETIMLGDAWDTDIVGATGAGMPAIWYNPTGKPRPQEGLKAPVYEVAELSQVPQVLRHCMQQSFLTRNV